MSERNWRKDWELPQKVTPGPWKVKFSEYPYLIGIYDCGVITHDSKPIVWMERCRANEQLRYDLEFIAESREALPYWLQRVRELEAQVKQEKFAYEAAMNGWTITRRRAEVAEKRVRELESILKEIAFSFWRYDYPEYSDVRIRRETLQKIYDYFLKEPAKISHRKEDKRLSSPD